MFQYTKITLMWKANQYLSSASKETQLFWSCLEDNFCVQHVTMETRQRSVLDLVITDTVEAIDKIQLQEKFADSDHLMLSWIINFEDSNHVYKLQGHTVSYDYAKGNYAAMQEELSSMRWEDLLQPLTVEDCWKTFKDVINRLEAKYILLKKITQEIKCTNRYG